MYNYYSNTMLVEATNVHDFNSVGLLSKDSTK